MLHYVERYGDLNTCHVLKYSIDINARNQGWTALQLAALNGHIDIVSILLNKAANSSILNMEGKTELDITWEEGQDKIATIIIETEFQWNNPDLLPSPLPMLPLAPLIEVFGSSAILGAVGGCLDTFDKWKIKELLHCQIGPVQDRGQRIRIRITSPRQ